MSKVDPARLREPAALVMLAVVVVQVFVMVERLLFGWEGSGFALRAATVVTELSSPLLTALAVGSLLLATRFGGPTPRAGLIALGALGALGVALVFSLISLLGTPFSGLGVRTVLETLLLAVPSVALMALGLLYVQHLRTTLGDPDGATASAAGRRGAPAPAPSAPPAPAAPAPAPAQPPAPEYGAPQPAPASSPVGALPPAGEPAPAPQYGEQPASYSPQQSGPQQTGPQQTGPQPQPAVAGLHQAPEGAAPQHPPAQEPYPSALTSQPVGQPQAASYAPPQEQPGYGDYAPQHGPQFGSEPFAPAGGPGGHPAAGDPLRRPESDSPLSAPAYPASESAAPGYSAEPSYSSAYGPGSYSSAETAPDLASPASGPYQTGQFLSPADQQQSYAAASGGQTPQQTPGYGGAAPGGQSYSGFPGPDPVRPAEQPSYDPPSYEQPAPPAYDQPSYGGYEPAPEPVHSSLPPYPDSTDPRQQQLAQAYQQAQSYQQAQQGYAASAPGYATGPQGGGYGQGYGGPMGHPQFPESTPYRSEPQSYPESAPQAHQAPQHQAAPGSYQSEPQHQAAPGSYQSEPQPQYSQPGARPSWEDPLGESTTRFEAVSRYATDPGTGPQQQPPAAEEPAIAPTAIYAPDRSAGRVIPEEDSGRDRVGAGPDQGLPWYGSERRDR